MKDILWNAFADEMEKVGGKADILPMAALAAGAYGVSKILPSWGRLPAAAVDNTVDSIRTRDLEGTFTPHGQGRSSPGGLSLLDINPFNPRDELGRRKLNPRQMGQFVRTQANAAAEEVRGNRDLLHYDAPRRTPQEAARRAIGYEDLANELGMPRKTIPFNFSNLTGLRGRSWRAGDRPFPVAKAVRDLNQPDPSGEQE
jgi:hypothetical protein